MAASSRPRKKAAPKLAAVDDLAPTRPETPAGPVVIGQSPRPLVPVFVLDDVTYSIPDQINPLVSNRYLEKMRTESMDAAGVWLLRRLFGDEVMDALSEKPYVSPEDIAAIADKVGSILFPPVEDKAASGAGN